MLIASLIICYLAIGGFTFGYLRILLNDSENGWETPGPFFGSILWPLTISLLLIAGPCQNLGIVLATKQLESKKRKLALQRQKRAELETIEEEVKKILSTDYNV